MALDFYRLDNNEHLFSLDDATCISLEDIFEAFNHWTGIFSDLYGDVKLSTENQKTLIKVIDNYIEKTNLDHNKRKTTSIIEFRGLLNYFSNKNIDFKMKGD